MRFVEIGHRTIENSVLKVVVSTPNLSLRVWDKRNGHLWEQPPTEAGIVSLKPLERSKLQLNFLCHLSTSYKEIAVRVEISLSERSPEVVISLVGIHSDALCREIAFPNGFVQPHGYVVIPHDEGLIYPVTSLPAGDLRFIVYDSGTGLSMPWFGATDLKNGWMGIIETPDDAVVEIKPYAINSEAVLIPRVLWRPSKGKLSYARVVRYYFSVDGGYNSLAKRYRQHAMDSGLFCSLREKKAVNPRVAKLIGAPDVWLRGDLGNHYAFAAEMKALGVEKMLLSNATGGEEVRRINRLGFLTSRYDNYRLLGLGVCEKHLARWRANFGDLASDYLGDASKFGLLNAEPTDLLQQKDGNYQPIYVSYRSDSHALPEAPYYCLCPSRSIEYARRRVPEELRQTPYAVRFLDTTTTVGFEECWNQAHPLTRSQDRQARCELLKYLGSLGLLVGSETGCDWAIPYVHYFEGMMSISKYRIENCGREVSKYLAPTPEYTQFVVGPSARVPLFQLVYHDAVVSTWYWGDSSHRLPEFWNRKDLFNILYGTVPLWILTAELYKKRKDRFLRSYQEVARLAEQVGYDEMLSHQFLSEDHLVQRTIFSSGVQVTVNFGNSAYGDGAYTIHSC